MPAEVTQNAEVLDQAAAVVSEPDEQAQPVSTEGQQEAPKGEDSGESAAPKTPLEAAKRVMAKESKPDSEKKSQTEAPPTKSEEKPGEDDDTKLPFKDHPRWKEMSSENRILKVAKGKNEEAIRSLEPKARTYDDLTSYLKVNNLDREGFASALEIATAVRNDPQAAYDKLKPILERLENMIGVRLPPDIQARVDGGTLDIDSAQELSRARSGHRLAATQVESIRERSDREAEERRAGDAEAQEGAVVEAINAAEREWTARDPDAAKLRPLVEDRLIAVGGMRPPRSAEEARALFDECLAHAKKVAGGFAPRPTAKVGVLPVSGSQAQTTSPVHKSSVDAARAALSTG